MANWFTRQLDRFTPFNAPGEVQRRKKREEEERQAQNAQTPTLRVNAAPQPQNLKVNTLKPQQPVNVFEDLNKNLVLNKPQNNVSVSPSQNQPIELPKAGTVVQPTLKVAGPTNRGITLPGGRNTRDIPDTPEMLVNRGLDQGKSWEDIAYENKLDLNSVRKYSQATRPDYGIKIERPNQGVGNRIRDIFDTNTESDKYRRQEGNYKAIKEGRANEVKSLTQEKSGNIISKTPIVGHGIKTLNTISKQIPQLYLTLKGDTNAQEAADQMFEENKGGLFNVGDLYGSEAAQSGDLKTGINDIALPTIVAMADLYSLGKGNLISEAIKEQGLKAGIRTQVPNIVKATAGNYVSGDLNTRAEGGTNEDAIKSGILNSIFGIVPDVGLPALTRGFKNKVIPRLFTGRGVDPKVAIEELDDAAISAGAEATNQALRPRPIPIRQDIPINEVIDEGVNVPVSVTPKPKGPIIRELAGDASQLASNEDIAQYAQNYKDVAGEAANNASRPNRRTIEASEGVTPRSPEAPFKLDEKAVVTAQDKLIDDYADMLRSMGEGNGVAITPDGRRVSNNFRTGETAGQRMTKAMWREEAERQLRAGKADSSIQKVFDESADPEVQALLSKGEQTPLPEGSPIAVKQVTGIPVTDQTVVPTGLPETPGTVRTTTSSAPSNAKSAAVAAQSPVTALPKEVQDVLDNPKQYSKRQVAAARNQRKLARQMAKTQEDTAAALQRIEATKAPTDAQPEGYAPTGEFAEGKRGTYQTTSRATEAAAGQREMANRSVDNLLDEIGSKESFTPGDRRRIAAALENVAKADPEDRETRLILKKLQSKSRTELAQGLAMWPRIARKSASADTLVGRWESKIARALEDPTKMTDEAFARVQKANDNFTVARDRAAQLEEQFKRTGSESDFKAWEDAHKAARQADTDAKFTEADVARRVLKGEKGAAVNKVLDDLKKEADVNTMDTITASMLSGTGTGFRNTFGTELAGIENRLFANTRAKITNKLFNANVGGYDRSSARLGRKVGIVKLGKDAARRAEIGGKNPLEWAKNWSTTINSGGESSLQSQVYSRLGKYYKNQLTEQGLSGKELDMRMRHALLTDPDGIGNTYLDAAMKSSGLTGIFQKGQTIEKAVTDWVGRGTDNKAAQAATKFAMRIAVGFPTATANFIAQSGKRLALGLPSFMETGFKLANGDKAAAALAFDRGLKEAGSGMAMLGMGVALGSQDLISGPYPSDPEERSRWEREGISENSIKIGNAWYPIPQGAGMLGLPIMLGAAIGREGDSNESVKELLTPKNLAELLPTDQLTNFLNVVSGDGAPQDLKNIIASSVRAGTPAGSLFNQISKSFDETKNDTTTKDFWSNVLDSVYSGIPGVNNMANIPDKVDDAGNVIKNPNPAELAFGATSSSQEAGEQRSAQIASDVNNTVQGLSELGVLDDANLKELLDDDELLIYNKLASGKQVDEGDIKKLQDAFVKGVSQTGDDTAYLEREQYDTNLAVLRLKKKLMEEDKTVKPSDLKKLETAIKRGEVYKDGQIPYDMIDSHKSIDVEEWRRMGDPEEEEYDPEMYQKLWDIDQALTKVGASYRKGSLDKGKYYAKDSGKGGGKGTKQLDTSFGKLGDFSFAPRVQEYSGIDAKAGNMPLIRVVRPNIVHKISSSG